MANEDNLKPVRSKSEARERGEKGGKASGAARAARKTLKEELLLLLELVEDGQKDSFNERISVSLIKEAVNGNTKAFEIIRDTIGEKPADKVDMNVKGVEAQTEFREYMELLKKGG